MTLHQINKAIKAKGYKAELFKGDGYFYFFGDDVDTCKEQGVYGVCHVTDLTVEQWIKELEDKMENK